MTSVSYADPEKASPPPEAPPANQAAQAPVNGNPDVTLSAAEIRALMAAAAAEAHAADSAALAQAAKIHAADADALAQGAAAKFNAVLQAKQPKQPKPPTPPGLQPTPAPAPSVTPTPTPSPEPTKSSDYNINGLGSDDGQPMQHCATVIHKSDGSEIRSGCD